MFLEWIFFGKIFSEKISFCGKEQMTPPGVENFVPAKLFPWKIFWPRNFFFLLAKYFPGKNLAGTKKCQPHRCFFPEFGHKKILSGGDFLKKICQANFFPQMSGKEPFFEVFS